MRSGLAVQARAHHHQVGLQLDQRVVVEAEAAHRPRREVLRDRVGPLDDEPSHERDGVRMLEVERDVALADVEPVVHRRAFESVRVVGTECVHAQEVGPRLRLDPQHRRAVLREVARRDRARGARAELEDVRMPAHAFPAFGRGVGPPGRVVHGRAARTGRRGVAVGRADHDERAREPVDAVDRAEELARRELRRRVDLARRVRRREHQVGLARDVVQLLHRVLREVRGDRPRSPRAPRRSPCSG